jgi:hypothetical protein
MNEENIKVELEKVINAGKDQLKSTIDEIIANAYTDILPHVLEDTDCNIQYRTVNAVENLLSGNFEINGDYLNIPCSTGDVRVRVKLTAHEYDGLRTSLIKVMPQCPKDLEIESLKKQLKRSYERY